MEQNTLDAIRLNAHTSLHTDDVTMKTKQNGSLSYIYIMLRTQRNRDLSQFETVTDAVTNVNKMAEARRAIQIFMH